MQKNLRQLPKKIQHINHLVIGSLTTTLLTIGCLSTDARKNRELAHVITQQQLLIDTLVAEREQGHIKELISNSEELIKAEAHLYAALNELRRSSQTLKEAVKIERLQQTIK